MPQIASALALGFGCAAILAAACTGSDLGDPPAGEPDGGRDSAADGPLGADADGATESLPTVTATSDGFTIDNGLLTVRYGTATGLTDYASSGAAGAPFLTRAYASVDLGVAGGGYVKSVDYAEHLFSMNDVTVIHDGFGAGIRVVVRNKAPGKPDIVQVFSVYSGLSYLLLDERVESTSPIVSNYLGALIVETGVVSPGPGADPRVLDVPFDNDEWVRYDSRVLGSDFSGTGYEVGAVYDSGTRNGVVVGSVTHDFWKTGFFYDATAGHLKGLNVWGGAATPDAAGTSGATYGKDGTHDVAKHGAMTGTTLTSPRIFVGHFEDWRAGLETYARANAVITPPQKWAGSVPFGWNSWAAFGLNVTASNITAVSDYLAANLQNKTFSNDGVVYINIDAGLATDPTPLVQYIHSKGQKAGTYRVPFSYFYSSSDPKPLDHVANGAFKYSDIVLRDESGLPIQHNGAYVLDATHPGTIALYSAAILSAKTQGFDYLKLDFMTNGALEGKHYDASIKTGIQAYHQAMKTIVGLVGNEIFVSLSIAPLFPNQYGHARRISCDVLGQLDDLQQPTYPHYGSTEYLLNSLTYGWWAGGTLYAFNDADAMALSSFQGTYPTYPPAWAKTRVLASVVAGTVFLDATNYTNAGQAGRAVPLLTNAGVNAIARKGASFRPLDGATGRVTAPIPGSTTVNAGSAATDVFVRDDGGRLYVAVFNYDPTGGVTKTIDLSRAGLDKARTYGVTDVWTQSAAGTASGTLSVTLGPGESRLLALQ
jgi:hypothetical protein